MPRPVAKFDFPALLARTAEGHRLSVDEARAAFEALMSGEIDDVRLAAFLTALHMRGETVDEIYAGASVLREKAVRLTAPDGAIDTCGTGGDAKGTYNISTAAALVVAACGVPVAKHGNRALSSQSGSSQVLELLGVKIGAAPARIERCFTEANIGFMMAPLHHTAMKHVGPVRQALGFRTIFNLLGPLSNPAHLKRQLIGVFDPAWLEPFAEVLHRLGTENAWVVHGADGLDELSTTGTSRVVALDHGHITSFEVTPEDAGLPRARLADLIGGAPEENAAALRRLLAGEPGAYRDIVVLNAAAALIISDKAADLPSGAKKAAQAIDSGAAKGVLDKLVEVSNG